MGTSAWGGTSLSACEQDMYVMPALPCLCGRLCRWVIFNDEKVAESEHPPKDLGYMYLYRRTT